VNLSEIRKQYPQYDDLDDDALAKGFHAKFYSDLPFADFAGKIGYTPQKGALGKVGEFVKDVGAGALTAPSMFAETLAGGARLLDKINPTAQIQNALSPGLEAAKIASTQEFLDNSRRAREFIYDKTLSDETKRQMQEKAAIGQDKELGLVEGFKVNAGAAIMNPRDTLRSALENLPSLIAGGAAMQVARPLGAAATGLAGYAATGALEGGGAYSQTLQEGAKKLAAVDDEQLAQTFPSYADDLLNGLPREQALLRLADRAATTAGGIAALFAPLVDKALGGQRLDKALFTRAGAESVPKSLGREGLAETLQGGGGQMAENIGAKAFIDRGQTLTEGVGAAAGAEGVAGLVTAGGARMLTGPTASTVPLTGDIKTDTDRILAADVTPIVPVDPVTAAGAKVLDAGSVDEAIAVAGRAVGESFKAAEVKETPEPVDQAPVDAASIPLQTAPLSVSPAETAVTPVQPVAEAQAEPAPLAPGQPNAAAPIPRQDVPAALEERAPRQRNPNWTDAQELELRQTLAYASEQAKLGEAGDTAAFDRAFAANNRAEDLIALREAPTSQTTGADNAGRGISDSDAAPINTAVVADAGQRQSLPATGAGAAAQPAAAPQPVPAAGPVATAPAQTDYTGPDGQVKRFPTRKNAERFIRGDKVERAGYEPRQVGKAWVISKPSEVSSPAVESTASTFAREIDATQDSPGSDAATLPGNTPAVAAVEPVREGTSAGDNAADIGREAPAGKAANMSAPAERMFLAFGDQRYEVKSLKEASEKAFAVRKEMERRGGNQRTPQDLRVQTESGRVIGYVGPAEKITERQINSWRDRADNPVLYDPIPDALAADENDAKTVATQPPAPLDEGRGVSGSPAFADIPASFHKRARVNMPAIDEDTGQVEMVKKSAADALASLDRQEKAYRALRACIG
jgi:hypothetical protein